MAIAYDEILNMMKDLDLLDNVAAVGMKSWNLQRNLNIKNLSSEQKTAL